MELKEKLEKIFSKQKYDLKIWAREFQSKGLEQWVIDWDAKGLIAPSPASILRFKGDETLFLDEKIAPDFREFLYAISSYESSVENFLSENLSGSVEDALSTEYSLGIKEGEKKQLIRGQKNASAARHQTTVVKKLMVLKCYVQKELDSKSNDAAAEIIHETLESKPTYRVISRYIGEYKRYIKQCEATEGGKILRELTHSNQIDKDFGKLSPHELDIANWLLERIKEHEHARLNRFCRLDGDENLPAEIFNARLQFDTARNEEKAARIIRKAMARKMKKIPSTVKGTSFNT